MTRLIPLLALAALASVTVPAGLSAQATAEAAIRDLEARQADAWNRHDASAYAALFTEDGDVVNVVGWWWRGRAEIESKLAQAFAYVFRESRLTITGVEVRLLSPDIAVARVRWTMEGARTPSGIPEPTRGIQLQVLTRDADGWSIKSFQNTNELPERPFPQGPPARP
ncbi:MAG: YybH family protein [Longimicrobiaceae bacterium]